MRHEYVRCHCRQCNRGFHHSSRNTRWSYKTQAHRMVRILNKRALQAAVKTGDFDSWTQPVYGLGYTD